MLKKNFIVKDKKKMSEIMGKLKAAGLIQGQHYGVGDTMSKNHVIAEHAKFWIAIEKMHSPLVIKILMNNKM